MLIRSVKHIRPVWGSHCFIAENATLTGDVILGDYCTIWYNAVIRGDVNSIRIGNRTNIQDGVIIHATYEKNATLIGNRVSIGHRAVIHGCEIKDCVLVGMGSIVMDRCVVEENTIIAAGAVLTEGAHTESGGIYAGIPARKIKSASQQQIEQILQTAENYIQYASWIDPENS